MVAMKILSLSMTLLEGMKLQVGFKCCALFFLTVKREAF
jgi:hypothetical protein